MKRFIFIITLFFILLPSFAGVRTFRLNVGQFDRLEVVDNLEVIYHAQPDSTGYLVYKADDSMADAILCTNTKGCLKIQIATEDINSDSIPTIHVYSDYLTSVSSSSLKPVTVMTNAPVPNFSAKLMGNGKIIAEKIKAAEVEANFVTGNGSIVLSGTCGKALYKMVGTGTIQADRMRAEIVNCKIIGSGSIGCWCLSKLDVRGIGSTKIYYKGTPEIKKVGGGKLFPLTLDNGEELNYVTSDN